jgi:aryl-alcohol dehydrogenase-like predicted oxidoreductase
MDLTLDTVSLGRTGLEVSELPFGTWRFGRVTEAGTLEIDRSTAFDLLDFYADAGGQFIDTADVYGGGDAEAWIGDWLEERDREDFVIASKVYWPTRENDPNGSGLSRKHIRRQIDQSLDRLGTDYLDLLYIHRWDDATPARELMRTLDGLVDDGRVNYLGASTLRPNTWRIARANEIARQHGWEPFTVTQPRYNLVNREIEGNYMEFCREQGLGICTWSPLAQGFLTGKYERGSDLPDDAAASETSNWDYLSSENFDVLDVARDIAESVGASPAQVALAYQLHHPDVTGPIIGARTVDQLEENLRAATVSLSDAQFDRLETAKPGPFDNLV